MTGPTQNDRFYILQAESLKSIKSSKTRIIFIFAHIFIWEKKTFRFSLFSQNHRLCVVNFSFNRFFTHLSVCCTKLVKVDSPFYNLAVKNSSTWFWKSDETDKPLMIEFSDLNCGTNLCRSQFAYFIQNQFFAGYDRELTYRHPDGSYSAFGPGSDGKTIGSTWQVNFPRNFSFIKLKRKILNALLCAHVFTLAISKCYGKVRVLFFGRQLFHAASRTVHAFVV